MKKLIPFIAIFICSCKKEIQQPTYTEPQLSFQIDSVFTQNGQHSLPKDNNGFYHLPLNKNSLQTFNRIIGTFFVDGNPKQFFSPIEARVEWESSHYWILEKGSNIFTIYKTYFNQFNGQQTTSTIGTIKTQQNELVPTINKNSIISSNGEFNTVFAPIYFMDKDTATITAKLIYSIEIPKDNLFSTYKIDSIKKSIRIICKL